MLNKAYSLLNVKAVDDEKRVITGIATTPNADREFDVVEPLGAKFKIPMPLLLYHNGQKPVGTVDFAQPTKDGIPFRASLPNVVEPGIVQDRVNEAWHSLKYKLLGAVSIGFRPLPGGAEMLKTGGIHYKSWEWFELTLCSIPMNPDAVVQSFKSMDPVQILRALDAQPEDAARNALIEELKHPRAVVRLSDIRPAGPSKVKAEDRKPGLIYL